MRDYREFLQRLNGQTYTKKVLETENEVASCNQFRNAGKRGDRFVFHGE